MLILKKKKSENIGMWSCHLSRHTLQKIHRIKTGCREDRKSHLSEITYILTSPLCKHNSWKAWLYRQKERSYTQRARPNEVRMWTKGGSKTKPRRSHMPGAAGGPSWFSLASSFVFASSVAHVELHFSPSYRVVSYKITITSLIKKTPLNSRNTTSRLL